MQADSFTIELFLSRLREAHPDMETLFLHGSCYELFNVMRVLWPQAEPWYVIEEGHVYVKVDQWFYDIRGRHRRLPAGNAVNLLRPYSSDLPHRWSKRHLHRLRLPPETKEPEETSMSSEPKPLTLIAAAIRVPVRDTGLPDSDHLIVSMPRPFRHPHILQRMHMAGIAHPNHPDDQGFLGSDGKFYGRDTSMLIAIAARQFKGDRPISDTLTSEDLW